MELNQKVPEMLRYQELLRKRLRSIDEEAQDSVKRKKASVTLQLLEEQIELLENYLLPRARLLLQEDRTNEECPDVNKDEAAVNTWGNPVWVPYPLCPLPRLKGKDGGRRAPDTFFHPQWRLYAMIIPKNARYKRQVGYFKNETFKDRDVTVRVPSWNKQAPFHVPNQLILRETLFADSDDESDEGTDDESPAYDGLVNVTGGAVVRYD
jgi:hypothetical protein